MQKQNTQTDSPEVGKHTPGIFEQLGEILRPENPETLPLKIELADILKKIESLERQQNGGYTAQVAKSFYLGMVGGSGRNTHRLNQRRANELDRTIDRAVILTGLYGKRNGLQTRIKYIESGQRDIDQKKKEQGTILMAEYWKGLKVGDKIDIGGNSPATITKKNAKSIETGTGCKWTATEIIGKKAASLL